MKKALFAIVLAVTALFTSSANVFAAKVKVEYLGQVTISGHKMHVVISDVNPDGTEYVISSGTVYTHVKMNEQPGAMYKGDSFITDADSPNNLVAALRSNKIYDMYAAERDMTISKQIIR